MAYYKDLPHPFEDGGAGGVSLDDVSDSAAGLDGGATIKGSPQKGGGKMTGSTAPPQHHVCVCNVGDEPFIAALLLLSLWPGEREHAVDNHRRAGIKSVKQRRRPVGKQVKCV